MNEYTDPTSQVRFEFLTKQDKREFLYGGVIPSYWSDFQQGLGRLVLQSRAGMVFLSVKDEKQVAS